MLMGSLPESVWECLHTPPTHHEHRVVSKLVLVQGPHQVLIITLTQDLPVGVVLCPVVQSLGPGPVLCGPQPQGDGVGVPGPRHGPSGEGGTLLLVDGFLLASQLLPVARELVYTWDVLVGCVCVC